MLLLRLAVLGIVLLGSSPLARTVFANQVVGVADGNGNDVCVITYPNVLAHSTEYPNVTFASGDTVQIMAQGCVQTGGSGNTWKRYVDPSGPNSDHHLR